MISVATLTISILFQVSLNQTLKDMPGCASNPSIPICRVPPPAQPITTSARSILTARLIAEEHESLDTVKVKNSDRCQAGASLAESRGRFDLKRMIERQCGKLPLGAK